MIEGQMTQMQLRETTRRQTGTSRGRTGWPDEVWKSELEASSGGSNLVQHPQQLTQVPHSRFFANQHHELETSDHNSQREVFSNLDIEQSNPLHCIYP